MESQNTRPDYLTVTVGSAVRTLDDQKVGTVSELRGSYFKIKTGFMQRDFWLRTDCVRTAVPNETVMLNVPKSGLDDIKIVDISLI